MVVLLAAVAGIFIGLIGGFVSVYALCEHFGWKPWVAILTAAIMSIPISIVVGGLLAVVVILVMYPDFNWRR